MFAIRDLSLGMLTATISCTKQIVPDAQRATLLLYHAFCTRLQDEDFTFIQRFVQRHLRFVGRP